MHLFPVLVPIFRHLGFLQGRALGMAAHSPLFLLLLCFRLEGFVVDRKTGPDAVEDNLYCVWILVHVGNVTPL